MKSTFRLIFVALFFIQPFSTFAQLSLTFTIPLHNGYPVSCFGGSDGQITVNVTGGTTPYTYLWSNSATTKTISGLTANYYSVTVTDANAVTATLGKNIASPNQLTLSLQSPTYGNLMNVSCYHCNNASISSAVSNGVTPYTYSWLDGPTTAGRSGLGKGVFKLTVIDVNGCSLQESISITEPDREDWSLSGNGVISSSSFIGTTDNKDLIFKTNGQERLRIVSDGKILMPSNGDSHFERLVTGRIASPDSLIYFGDSTLIFNTSMNRIYGDPNGTIFRGTGIGLGTVAYGRYSIALGRNCLIGTYAGTNGSNADDAILIGNGLTATAAAIGSIVIGAGITGGARMIYSVPHTIAIGLNSSIPTVVITQASGTGSTGSVYIGLPDPTNLPPGLTNYKLAVNGNILATEVKVKLYTDWDKVFGKDYNLISQEELSKYLIEYHHLPNMPSYEEMKKEDGISVGDFQMRTLRTIEEQALYILDQDKRLKELDARIKALESKIEKR